MQISRFSTGGFVLHGITHLCASRISAWYDAAGTLLDAEYSQRGRAVDQKGPVRDALKALGPVWARRDVQA